MVLGRDEKTQDEKSARITSADSARQTRIVAIFTFKTDMISVEMCVGRQFLLGTEAEGLACLEQDVAPYHHVASESLS